MRWPPDVPIGFPLADGHRKNHKAVVGLARIDPAVDVTVTLLSEARRHF